MGNKELRFLLCKTEQTSTSLSPTPPPAFHSLILTIALMALSGQLSRSARVQQGVFPEITNFWKFVLKRTMLQTRTKDINKGTEIHQQSKWDGLKFRRIWYQ